MKLLIIGDQHFRLILSYGNSFKDGRQTEWKIIKNKIIKSSKECDAVFLLGDNFNYKNNPSSIIKEFIEFINAFGEKEIYIISGNHERYGKETALDFLQKINKPNLHVFTEFTKISIKLDKNITAAFLPYMTPGTLETENIEEATKKIIKELPSADILFHHHAVSGVKLTAGTSELLNEIVLPKEKIEKKYKWIVGGHIHQHQFLSKKTLVTGNIFTQEVGEYEKFIFILDTKKEEFKSISLPVRGIYKVEVKKDDYKKILKKIPDNSIVKCYIIEKGIDLDDMKQNLERFDASVLIEKYPNFRTKVKLDETGVLDLSLHSLLKIYSEEKKISYNELKQALELIQ